MAIDLAKYPGYAGWNETEALADIAAGHGAGKMAQSQGGGTDSINLSQVPSTQEFVQEQIAGEDVTLQALLERMGQREKPLDIFQGLEEQAGLPELRGAARTLTGEIESIEDVLKAIEPDVSARTRQSLVTEAQRRGLVQEGKKPFLEKLGEFGTALSRIVGRIGEAERGVVAKTELALRGQEMGLQPLELYYATLVDRNARLASAFSTDRQTQLDLLFDKLKRERQLSDMDWELANTLGSEERQYLKSLQAAAAELGYGVTGNESIDELLSIIGKKSAEQIAFERRDKGPSRTETRDQQSQKIATWFVSGAGTREEALNDARAMVAQGYPADLVYDELDRIYPDPKNAGSGLYNYGENE